MNAKLAHVEPRFDCAHAIFTLFAKLSQAFAANIGTNGALHFATPAPLSEKEHVAERTENQRKREIRINLSAS